MSSSERNKVSRRHVLSASLGAAAFGAAGALPAVAGSKRPKPLEGKRVLVCIGEFCEGMETYYMVYRLLEEGAVLIVAAPTVKRLQTVVHDFEPAYEGYTEKLGYMIQVDIAYEDVKAADYDGLLLPGGRAPEEIRQNKHLVDAVGHFLDKKKPLGAMCHGVMLLYTARPIRGRRMTAYSGIRRDIELLGGKFSDEPVVVDGPLVTSRGWPDLPQFMPAFLEVLKRR